MERMWGRLYGFFGIVGFICSLVVTIKMGERFGLIGFVLGTPTIAFIFVCILRVLKKLEMPKEEFSIQTAIKLTIAITIIWWILDLYLYLLN